MNSMSDPEVPAYTEELCNLRTQYDAGNVTFTKVVAAIRRGYVLAIPFSAQAVADGHWEVYHDDDCGGVITPYPENLCLKCGMHPDLQSRGARRTIPVTQAAPVTPRIQSAQDVIQEVIKSVPSDGSLGKFLKDKLAVLGESFDTERRLTNLAGRVLEFMSHEYGEHLPGERPDVEELIALAQAALDSVTLTPSSKEKV